LDHSVVKVERSSDASMIRDSITILKSTWEREDVSFIAVEP